MGPRPDGRGKKRPCPFVRPAVPASMGPRPDGRGKYGPAWCALGVSLRQWGRGQTAAESREPGVGGRPGFASMGPRPDGRGKEPPVVSALKASPSRQWGRGQTAAESCLNAVPVAAANQASMGPRPDGRGKHTTHCRSAWKPLSVNGAAARRPRKVVGDDLRGAGVGASMGPRPDGRGKVERRRRSRQVCGVNGAAARRPRKAGSC